MRASVHDHMMPLLRLSIRREKESELERELEREKNSRARKLESSGESERPSHEAARQK